MFVVGRKIFSSFLLIVFLPNTSESTNQACIDSCENVELRSLTLRSFSQVPKGMVHPKITFCNKKYMGLLGELSLAAIEGPTKEASDEFYKLLLHTTGSRKKSKRYRRTADDFRQLMIFLIALKHTFSGLDNLTTNAKENETFREWEEVKSVLTDNWLVSTLLFNASGSESFRLGVIQQYLDMSFMLCHRGKTDCNADFMEQFLSASYSGCHTYDPREGGELLESRVQGITNGITFVFLTGSKLIASQINSSRSAVSHLSNPLNALSGTEGVRLLIHAPNESFWPEHGGIDIAPGFSTLIGVTSKESVRMPQPYGECTDHNIEIDTLIESIGNKLGYTPKRSEGLHESVYTTLECRSSCLQRYVWETCGCLLMGEYLPFLNSSLLCGHPGKAIEALYNHTELEKKHCLTLKNMMKEECKFLQKIFADLKCLSKVLGRGVRFLAEETQDLECHCPVPCRSQDYELTFSLSKWPSSGAEMDSAYNSLVKNRILPKFQEINLPIADGPINYLSNMDNKAEIMENFARVTVFVKSLKVQKTQQVAAYTLLDLFSDIGKLFFSTFCRKPQIEAEARIKN